MECIYHYTKKCPHYSEDMVKPTNGCARCKEGLKDDEGRHHPSECPTCGEDNPKLWSLFDGSYWECQACGCLAYD